MKFTTKVVQHYPAHLRHVASLPWEINNSNFLQIHCIQQMWKKCKHIVF